MKKILLLIPSMMAVSVIPFVALTSCVVEIGGGDTPDPEYTEIELFFIGERHYSNEFDLIKGNKYKFVETYITSSEDNFWFEDSSSYYPDIDVTVEKILINGQESTHYKIRSINWVITEWHHDSGPLELYLIANATTTNLYAVTGG